MLHTPDSISDFAEQREALLRRGWCTFACDSGLSAWVEQVRPQARAIVSAPENAEWLRYGGTWFAGVNVLGNDAEGRVGADGIPLDCSATRFIVAELDLEAPITFGWDSGQVSVCYPGYPRPMEGETEGAFRYRVRRDAAHLDGLHPVGTERRRHLREPHAFILGVPLTHADTGASPLVVWDGSHEMIRAALLERLQGVSADAWMDVDLTDTYQAVRKKIFDECPRTIVHARPGECYLLHRLALHGVSPWQDGASADADGRMIAYFRPEAKTGPRAGVKAWLTAS